MIIHKQVIRCLYNLEAGLYNPGRKQIGEPNCKCLVSMIRDSEVTHHSVIIESDCEVSRSISEVR
jgi:hypothetical protein